MKLTATISTATFVRTLPTALLNVATVLTVTTKLQVTAQINAIGKGSTILAVTQKVTAILLKTALSMINSLIIVAMIQLVVMLLIIKLSAIGLITILMNAVVILEDAGTPQPKTRQTAPGTISTTPAVMLMATATPPITALISITTR